MNPVDEYVNEKITELKKMQYEELVYGKVINLYVEGHITYDIALETVGDKDILDRLIASRTEKEAIIQKSLKKNSMKTIQQVLQELPTKEIKRVFFHRYPFNLMEVKEQDNITIREYKKKCTHRFLSFLNTLRKLEVKRNPGETGILYLRKNAEDYYDSDGYLELVYAEELLRAKEFEEVSSYAYEFSAWEEAVGFFVADNKLTQDNLIDVAVQFLYEVSFLGYVKKDVDKKRAEFYQSLEESDKQMKKSSARPYTYDEFHTAMRDELGLPTEEIYPEEQELRSEIIGAQSAYAEYCRKVELERIRQQLTQDRKEEA